MSRFAVRRRVPIDELRFFLLWLRRPLGLGAVVPSSKALATAMTSCLEIDTPGVVVELGGGTGNISRAILDAGIAPRDLIVVEREAGLCAAIAARTPGVNVVCADARNLKALLDNAGVGTVKAVVSGLPLLSMEAKDRRRILAAAFAVLPQSGEFLQFTYSPVAPISRQACAKFGIEGVRLEWVLSNLPPAAVWRYRRRAATMAATRRVA